MQRFLPAKTASIKALSKAYFRMLEKHPVLQEVFQLGSRVIWVAPAAPRVVIDQAGGLDTMSDDEIERLFVKK